MTRSALSGRFCPTTARSSPWGRGSSGYNWPAGSNRYQRVARFTDHLFSRIDKLQVAGFDPKWKTINLSATVPGLTRFPATQEWLDRQARKTADKR